MAQRGTVLAIDPGRSKCGIAVVIGGTEPEVLYRAVVPTDQIAQVLVELAARHRLDLILIGNGTTSSEAAQAAETVAVPVELVEERLTSVEARKRYFAENPPRGIRRLIPTSLQTPDRPYDDYVAVILAERYLHLTSDL